MALINVLQSGHEVRVFCYQPNQFYQDGIKKCSLFQPSKKDLQLYHDIWANSFMQAMKKKEVLSIHPDSFLPFPFSEKTIAIFEKSMCLKVITKNDKNIDQQDSRKAHLR
jgi:hypothetical protein